MKKTNHPIIDALAKIKVEYAESFDPETTPTDRQEFIDWLWESQIKNCQSCPLYQNRFGVVRWDGKVDAKIMVVLEGPGQLEEASLMPLVGPSELRSSRCGSCNNVYDCFSHKLLDSYNDWNKKNRTIVCNPDPAVHIVFDDKKYIKSTGAIFDGILVKYWKMMYPRHNWVETYNKNFPNNTLNLKSPFWITNAALCRTTDLARLKNMSPENGTLRACRKWLACQYVAVQPQLILVFGRVALISILGNEKAAMAAKPDVVMDSKFGPILYQVHPSSIMQEPNKELRRFGYAKLHQTIELALQYCGYEVK